jgi:hypothetical protein
MMDKAKSWAELFKTKIYHSLPITEITDLYCNNNGRSTKNLRTMTSVFVIQEMYNLTNIQVLDGLKFDMRFQHACNLGPLTDEKVRVREKTYYNFRQKIYENNLAETIFNSATLRLIEELNVDTFHQRLDSTHLRSNMKSGTRLGLLTSMNAKFLKTLSHTNSDLFSDIPEEIRKKYFDDKCNTRNYFADKNANHSRNQLPQVADDTRQLITKFADNANITKFGEYKLMVKIFDEQRVVASSEDGSSAMAVKVKDPKDVGCNSVQWPSDPDAAYSAHKGKGYQVQICETFSVTDGTEDKPLNLITHVKLEKASDHDADALKPAIEDLVIKGIKPAVLLADTAYGGDDNWVFANESGINLISPVTGLKHNKDKSENDDSVIAAKILSINEINQFDSMSREYKTDLELYPEEAAEVAGLGSMALAGFRSTKTGTILSCPMGHAPIRFEFNKKHDGGQAFFDFDTCGACLRKDDCPVKVRVTIAKLTYSFHQIRIAKLRAKEETHEFKRKYR